MPNDYYHEKLAAEKLRRVYESAPPRIRQYLCAEIDHVCSLIRPSDTVLELGCGYGRVLRSLSESVRFAVGIDMSMASLRDAYSALSGRSNIALACMNAVRLAFASRTFDAVVCIQNGISAFHVDRKTLVRESVRVTKPGGQVLLSSYTESFWPDRLAWFEQQAADGLVGPIDYQRTGAGKIFCTDGFHATTVTETEFRTLLRELSLSGDVYTVDDSSLFCRVTL
jgi:SAM-dependent methyltransferase